MKIVDFKLAIYCFFAPSFVQAGDGEDPEQSIGNLSGEEEGEVIFTHRQVENLIKRPQI